ncbi:MAG: T9SS type A sorting domain-containing protein [Bacteroidetes bacterium]|nr:T9SS type A sorting domain-containing protein [Bacteroidota bacterium]
MKISALLLTGAAFCTSLSLSALGLPAGRASATPSYKTENNDCRIPTSQFSMDINDTRVTLLTGGDLWNDAYNTASGYEVPKGPRGTANPNAIFTGSIWISGFDAGNNLKIAAQMYRQSGGTDFYSGPLDNSGNTVLPTCNMWDQHFPVWGSQIRPLVSAYQAAINAGGVPGSITLPLSSYSDSIKYWPGKGNPYLAALGYDVSGPLAPFYDADGDGSYDPAHGDYPTIRQGGIDYGAYTGCGIPMLDSTGYTRYSAYADEMVFWVFNDKGNTHYGSQGGAAIGVQVNALAFAFLSGDFINEMSFTRYHIMNKSGGVLNRTYLSQFTDPDLGCPYNDKAGCDTSLDLAFVYNGVPQNTYPPAGQTYVGDVTGSAACSQGTIGYGYDLPILGIALMETPQDTSSQQGYRGLGMTNFMVMSSDGSSTPTPMDPPQSQVQYRNFQMSKWSGGSPLTWGGTGYQSSATQTPYMYPGDPSDATQWSECNSQTADHLYASDRRIVQSSGPFTFMPCASQFLTVLVTFSRPINTNCPSWASFIPPVDTAIRFFKTTFDQSGQTGITTLTADALQLYPNPVTSDLLISSTGKVINEIKVYDLSGRLIQTQSGSDIHSIDMSVLTEGVYMVHLRSGSQTTTQRIVKR